MSTINAIYGAGIDGKRLFKAMSHLNLKVDLFIDEFSHVEQIDGCPVYRLHEVAGKENICLFLSIMAILPFSKNNNITLLQGLNTEGFCEVIPLNKVQSTFHVSEWEGLCDYEEYLHENYEYIRFYEQENDVDGISWLKKNLKDSESVHILDRLLDYRKDVRRGPILGLAEQTPQYFPPSVDIFRGIEKLRFVDCGAADGDTIRDVLRYTTVPVDYIASFEPELKMFKKMHDVISLYSARFPYTSFVTYSAGVWEKSGFCYLSKFGDDCAKVTNDMSIGPAIPVLSLDSALSNIPPNFIKMDVEGAEYEALKGASDIISRYHPTLAISIYHKHSDIWRLPQLVKQLNPIYELYIRHHFWGPWETVLYCVAPDGPSIT
ncbi:FkbM family methyltransferase [Aeromonas hydrophila]|uniref:FkbM family methyltransferase n=1 Tax=Aeromonas hydrophila TaxID=644 RepID=UPI0038D21BCC